MAISVREAARRAGVSPATVSNVLNGRVHVAEHTREKVLRVLHEGSYQRPASLKTRLLVVFPYVSIESTQPGQSYFVHEIILGIQQSLARRRQTLVMAGTDGLIAPPSIPELDDCSASFVVGGAFHPDTLTSIGRLLRSKPTVVVGTTVLDRMADCVVADNTGGVEQAVSYLIEIGHRRIALINGLPSSSSASEKLEGYGRAMQASGLGYDSTWVCTSDYSIARAQAAAHRLLTSANPPTAILVADDPMAIGVIQAARLMGLRVPDDVSVVGFGDDYPGIEPPLTTVRVNKRRLGELAYFLMHERLEGERASDELVRLVLSTQLMVRATTGPPPRGG